MNRVCLIKDREQNHKYPPGLKYKNKTKYKNSHYS